MPSFVDETDAHGNVLHSYTLPPINQPENFIPGFLLYLAEMYSVMMGALSLFVVAMPLPPRPSRAATEGKFPTVDVFVPTYNEDAALLANPLAAARAMDYPADKVTVWAFGASRRNVTRWSERTSGEVICGPRPAPPRPAAGAWARRMDGPLSEATKAAPAMNRHANLV